jgi:microcystin-dependent protein
MFLNEEWRYDVFLPSYAKNKTIIIIDMRIIHSIQNNLLVLLLMTGIAVSAQVHFGDNLGTHKAIKTLEMQSNNIDSIGAISTTPCVLTGIKDGAAIGTAAETVDKYSTFVITPAVTGARITIPVPTISIAGRAIIVLNSSTFYFVIKLSTTNDANNQTVAPGSSVTLVYNGQKWISPATMSGIPGEIRAFAGTTPPDGWLLCDGSSVSRSTYAGLFYVISTAYGTADGTSFNLPDLRGRFLRGADNGAGNDPNASSRSTIAAGGNTGDAVGSLQGGATKIYNTITTSSFSIKNAEKTIYTSSFDRANGLNVTDLSAVYGTITGSASLPTSLKYESKNLSATIPQLDFTGSTVAIDAGKGDNETRPVNVAVNYIIKY